MDTARRVCTQCRSPLPRGAAFCSSCGAATPTEIAGDPAGDFAIRLAQALAGRYTIERELGQGGMAIVYLAHDLRHDRQVALKVLRPDSAAFLGAERFLREIKLAARLNHPNILPLYDSGEAGDILYYAMPLVEGRSLRAVLQQEGPLPLGEALRIGGQLAAGLAYAHEQGVIHRDIKPENILLTRGHVRIADFGIGKAVGDVATRALTSTGVVLGTPLYMSPEQASGDPHVDHRADIYSLGCVLYEMLAGEPPFSAATYHAVMAKHALAPRPSVRTLRDGVPDAIDQAIQRAMASSAADRFATVGELVASISAPDADAASTAEDHGFRLRPSFTAGLFGGLAGGLAWGAVSGFGYVDALSPPVWNVSVSEKARLLGETVLAGAFTGAVLGAGIQVGSQWAFHRRAAERRAALGGGAIECAGSVGGGIVSGMVAGLIFALLFASRELPVPNATVTVSGGVLVSVLLVLAVLMFDYRTRWSDLAPPMLGAVVVTVVIVTIGALVLPFRWMLESFLAGDNRVKHALGGLIFGSALGSVLGFQVGMSLVLDGVWRRIRPASAGPPPRRTAPVWQRALALVATALAGAAVLLLVHRTAGGRASSPAAEYPHFYRILVLPFAGDDPAAPGLGESMARELSAHLTDAGRWFAVDPQEVLTRLSADSAASPRSVEELSALAFELDASRFVIGRIADRGGRLHADADLYEWYRSEPVGSASWAGAPGDLPDASTELARQLLTTLAWQGMDFDAKGVVTKSLAALRAHLNGELALDEGRLDDAVRQFEEVVRLDGGFALAWLRFARVAGFAQHDAQRDVATQHGDSLLRLMSPWDREHVNEMARREAERDIWSLLRMGRTALGEGDLVQAEHRGRQALAEAAENRQARGYSAFVHDGNALLGRVALRHGDTTAAKRLLLAAAAAPRPAARPSFQPRFALARELLDAGERDAVIQYLELCAAFWDTERLDDYIATVRRGGVPADWLRVQ